MYPDCIKSAKFVEFTATLEQERVMSEQKLSERMESYEGHMGVEMRGRKRVLVVDTPEFTDWLNAVGKLERAEAKLSKMEEALDLLAEAEDVLDNQSFKVTKETWEGWERWKMGAMEVSREIKELWKTEAGEQ